MRKKAISALILLAIFIFTPYALAQDQSEWVHVNSHEKNAESDIYARIKDLQAGTPTSTAARVWVKFDFRRNKKVPYRSAMILYTVNCVTQTYHTTSQTFFMPDGTAETAPDSYKLEYVIPGTNMAFITGVLCYDPETSNIDYR